MREQEEMQKKKNERKRKNEEIMGEPEKEEGEIEGSRREQNVGVEWNPGDDLKSEEEDYDDSCSPSFEMSEEEEDFISKEEELEEQMRRDCKKINVTPTKKLSKAQKKRLRKKARSSGKGGGQKHS
ncbi:PREDICTED: FACT complex subunit SPT16-like [Ipomoea nil]|uniref:FACT complex subunit SPT16-like n=1 Tax=Ipomoea nil TaxID=35883 RepID=UPI000901D822|nr:PREDICTED: FACT complex subunit SPT16-like [Ipomoea nil]